MPTTRAARAAARAAARLLTDVLPADVLSHVLYYLPLAHDIALAGLTCHALCDAAKLAFKARPFSGKVVTLAGHSDWIRCVVAAADGRVITGSDDRTVAVWRDGACEHAVEHQHEVYVMAVGVLPLGGFVSIDDDGVAKVWTAGMAFVRTFRVNCVVYGYATVMLNGVPHVVGHQETADGDGREIRLYDINGTLTHTFEGHASYGGWLNAVVATNDGRHLITCASYNDRNVNIWSVATKTLVSKCAHINVVLALAVLPDGQRFLSGGHDNTVRVWLIDGDVDESLLNHSLLNSFKLHDSRVTALAALPDNQHALSSSEDCTVKLFNVNDGATLRTFRNHTAYGGRYASSLALMPDGLRFVSGGTDNTARIVEHGLAPL